MRVDELIDRTLLVGFEEPDPPEWIRRVAPGLGAVVLYGQNLRVDADTARIAGIFHADGPTVLAVDEEGGDVTRLHYRAGSDTPGNHVLGTVDDVAATRAVAAHIGADLRAAGVGWDFAPDADVNTDPANPVIGVRSFGADPALVSRHTVAWIEGLQGQGVAACAKHFPGHGDTRTDSHLELPTVDCSKARWRAWHLPPFEAAIRAGTRSVMTAHIRFPAFDPVPATVSERFLTGLLRSELGFAGVIVSDALDMAAVAARYGIAGAAVAALAAGVDALCLGPRGGERLYREVRDAIGAAIDDGDLPLRRVEEAAERVMNLHRAGTRPVSPARDDCAATDLARRAVLARDVPALGGRPVLIELRTSPNLAVGAAAWNLAGPLTALGLAPALVVRMTEADAVTGGGDPVDVALAQGGPVVVAGRDVARRPWQRAVWDAVRAARPDAVLVDLGLPRPADLAGPVVLTGGAGRPNLRAAAEVLVAGHPATGAHPVAAS
jgi:beta-N-acetylhexosaminidase